MCVYIKCDEYKELSEQQTQLLSCGHTPQTWLYLVLHISSGSGFSCMFHTNKYASAYTHTHQRVKTKSRNWSSLHLSAPPHFPSVFQIKSTCISAYLLSLSLPSLSSLLFFVTFSTPVFLVADAYDMLGLGWNGPVCKKSQWSGENERESKRRKRFNLHVSRELKERNLKPPKLQKQSSPPPRPPHCCLHLPPCFPPFPLLCLISHSFISHASQNIHPFIIFFSLYCFLSFTSIYFLPQNSISASGSLCCIFSLSCLWSSPGWMGGVEKEGKKSSFPCFHDRQFRVCMADTQRVHRNISSTELKQK